ncbi:Lipase, GDSL [Corchorus olitorius]|uniref:Lipase, GDSL n=1 Tax=Corchorus olitorius TaxID=93759 RepID=A0A1R3I3M1_9ROSI|nr:Lipase, GDSL [Corchorus olitorius]
MKMERIALFMAAAVVVMGTSSAMGQESSSWNVSAMYVLGDSSVDCGLNSMFYPFVHRSHSLLPCNGSNSILPPYLLAEKMGLPYPESFYIQNGSTEALLSGLNFGAAEATIMSPNSLSHQSLNIQLRQLFETFQLLELQLGQEIASRFTRSSMVYLSFGKDDYISLFLHRFSGVMVNYSSQAFAQILVDQMVRAMRNLYNMNVRKVVCMGLLPLGCTPSLLSEWHIPTTGRFDDVVTGCVEVINQLVLEYNTMLEEQIVILNQELLDAQIVFCDVYHGLRKIITYPNFFGFKEAKSACCGLGLYNGVIGCLSSDMACNNVSAHVWWDLYNPTPQVNSLLADSMWSGEDLLSNICRPTTLHHLFYNPV